GPVFDTPAAAILSQGHIVDEADALRVQWTQRYHQPARLAAVGRDSQSADRLTRVRDHLRAGVQGQVGIAHLRDNGQTLVQLLPLATLLLPRWQQCALR